MKSTRRGSDSPVHRPEKTPRFQIQLAKWPLSPGTPREASGVPCLSSRRGLTLLMPQPEKDLERPSSTRLEARFPYCREPAYCILSAYCILHIEYSTFHSIIFQDLE